LYCCDGDGFNKERGAVEKINGVSLKRVVNII
jgi:hypothetical protein